MNKSAKLPIVNVSEKTMTDNVLNVLSLQCEIVATQAWLQSLWLC